MQPEEVKAFLPIFTAYAEGKIIQFSSDSGETWRDYSHYNFNEPVTCYRVKPEIYKYKRYIYTNNNQSTLHFVTEQAVQDNLKVHGEKIRWIDTEWQYVEV